MVYSILLLGLDKKHPQDIERNISIEVLLKKFINFNCMLKVNDFWSKLITFILLKIGRRKYVTNLQNIRRSKSSL